MKRSFHYPLQVFFISILLLVSCRKADSFKSTTNHSSHVELKTGSRPNIVFMLLDDVGSEVPTCYGGQSYQTPNIDRLAQGGMRFTQCYGSPVCSPSRFMLLTGKYNFRNYTIWGKMNPNEKTIATLLRDAGYATYVSGKWQLDGGDTSIHSLGFNDYSVWLPFANVAPGSHYRDPVIYEHGSYLNSADTKGKFGDDIFTDRVLNFIDLNKDTNFFVYFPITLSHSPFIPTPDDPEFLTWPKNQSDTSFFPSMVNYMDQKVGDVVDHLKELGIYNNTLVIVAGDNGTSQYIYSYNHGKLVRGGKGKTNVYGTKLPFVVTWPNFISSGTIDSSLVDFTDLLPTFADVAGITIPAEYGIIDGKSFYSQLLGDFSSQRDWVFNHFQPSHDDGEGSPQHDPVVQLRLQRWANTKEYKLYDSTGYFYDIIKDPLERKRLINLTAEQLQVKGNLQVVIDSMHN